MPMSEVQMKNQAKPVCSADSRRIVDLEERHRVTLDKRPVFAISVALALATGSLAKIVLDTIFP
jgi:hypothetical protein